MESQFRTSHTSSMEHISDESLMRQFQQGDEYAFELLVNRFKGRIFNFTFRYINNEELAEDLTQETFLRLYTKKHLYREIAKLSTWLFTIAKNLIYTELRRQRTRKKYSLSELGYEASDFEIPTTDHVDSTLNAEITDRAIQQALMNLPPHYRTTIILRDLQSLSYTEIANIMGVPRGTVKSRLNRGRLQLREYLERFAFFNKEKETLPF